MKSDRVFTNVQEIAEMIMLRIGEGVGGGFDGQGFIQDFFAGGGRLFIGTVNRVLGVGCEGMPLE